MSADRIAVLQRALLDILRAGIASPRARQCWCELNGFRPSDSAFDGLAHPDVRSIRTEIQALDPNACLYPSWGGPMPSDL